MDAAAYNEKLAECLCIIVRQHEAGLTTASEMLCRCFEISSQARLSEEDYAALPASGTESEFKT